MQPILTKYKGYRFRSRLEARWAVFFDSINVRWDYEPEGFILADGTHYLPDFLLKLPSGPLWVEIKPVSGDQTKYEKFKRIMARGHRCTILHEIPDPYSLSNGYLWGELGEVGAEIVDGYDPETGGQSGDIDYMFCVCRFCGTADFQYYGRSERIKCECAPSIKTLSHKDYTQDHPVIVRGFKLARSARFEHGEACNDA